MIGARREKSKHDYASYIYSSNSLMHNQMALDSNGWLREEHKPNGNEPDTIYAITREQSLSDTNLLESSTKSILTQTQHRLVIFSYDE